MQKDKHPFINLWFYAVKFHFIKRIECLITKFLKKSLQNNDEVKMIAPFRVFLSNYSLRFEVMSIAK